MSKIDLIEQELRALKLMYQSHNDEILTISEVASYLKVTEESVRGSIRWRGLPMTRKAGKYRILKSKLIEWLNND